MTSEHSRAYKELCKVESSLGLFNEPRAKKETRSYFGVSYKDMRASTGNKNMMSHYSVPSKMQWNLVFVYVWGLCNPFDINILRLFLNPKHAISGCTATIQWFYVVTRLICRIEVRPKQVIFYGKDMRYFEVSAQSNYSFENPFLYLPRKLVRHEAGLYDACVRPFPDRNEKAFLSNFEHQLQHNIWRPLSGA